MPTKILLSALLLLSLIGWQPTTPARPKLLGVAHMALGVSDIEKARTFYKDFLGFTEPYDLKNADGSLALTFI
ncbi:MAG: VOC family protein, partial [Acidobacteriota bacterium]